MGLSNLALADLTYRNLALVGLPVLGEGARQFGREIQKYLGLAPMDDPFIESCQRLVPPCEAEANLRKGLPAWQLNFTSDDYVEYTWHAPTVRLYTGRPSLRAPTPGSQYPAWTRNALGGVPCVIDPMTMVAGKTIGPTLVDLLTEPAERAKAKPEFIERTGGGVGGSKWVAPLLPRVFVPPIDLRWPEYVTTPHPDLAW